MIGTVPSAGAFATAASACNALMICVSCCLNLHLYFSDNSERKCHIRKKRGQKPTGILVRAAKASGFSSVSEMIDVKVPNNLGEAKLQNVAVSPVKEAPSNKVC